LSNKQTKKGGGYDINQNTVRQKSYFQKFYFDLFEEGQ
ncbi:MAG: hypothetical protein RIQ33_1513, partial [Bacteroidota bacterium]